MVRAGLICRWAGCTATRRISCADRRTRGGSARTTCAASSKPARRSIATHPDGTPYPSRLVLGWPGAQSLHAVVAENAADQELVVITVHEPDPALCDETFRRRRTRPS
jgi:hypothetical protein